MPIRTFADKRIERAFRNDDYRKVHPSLRRRVRAALSDLDQARSPPGYGPAALPFASPDC